jgi:hypothetical protein
MEGVIFLTAEQRQGTRVALVADAATLALGATADGRWGRAGPHSGGGRVVRPCPALSRGDGEGRRRWHEVAPRWSSSSGIYRPGATGGELVQAVLDLGADDDKVGSRLWMCSPPAESSLPNFMSPDNGCRGILNSRR